MKRIKPDTELYDAIYDTVYDIFTEKISLSDPATTTEEFVKALNERLEEVTK